MEKYPLGMRVCNKVCFPGDDNFFSGQVIGHGWANGNPVVIVLLDAGGYIVNEFTKTHISTIVVHTDNLEREDGREDFTQMVG